MGIAPVNSMNVMRTRLIGIGIVFALFAATFALFGMPKQIVRTESWLQDSTPSVVGAFHAIPGPNGDRQTYRMSQPTYDTLAAFGIDCQIFTDGVKQFDVCVIAGNHWETFHDPMLCFPNQDWNILERKDIQVETKTRGSIPIAVIRTQHTGSGTLVAAFTFKAPMSMVTSQYALARQWSFANFLSGKPKEGAFYRFIGDSNTSEEDLLKFVADFMDAIGTQSKGIL